MKPEYKKNSGIGFADIHPPRSQLDRETWIVDMSFRHRALAEAKDAAGLLELANEYKAHGMNATAHGIRVQASRIG